MRGNLIILWLWLCWIRVIVASQSGILVPKGGDFYGTTKTSRCGYDVAMNAAGDTIVVGCPFADIDNVVNAGAAYILTLTNGNWSEQAPRLNGTTTNENCGYNVAVNAAGNVVIMACPHLNSVYYRIVIARMDINAWTNVSYLQGGKSEGLLDCEVALNSAGDILAVGLPSIYGNTIDRVIIYQYIEMDSVWHKLDATLASLFRYQPIGVRVSISATGNQLAVLSYNSSYGLVEMFSRMNGSWVPYGQRITSNRTNEFTNAVVAMSGSGDYVVIGTSNYTYKSSSSESHINAGRVRVFRYSNNSWRQIGSDIVGTQMYQYLGYSVDIDNDGTRIIVGSRNIFNGYGGCQLYEFQSVSDWMQIDTSLTGSMPNEQFGSSVAFDAGGHRFAVGAYLSNHSSTLYDSGRVAVYDIVYSPTSQPSEQPSVWPSREPSMVPSALSPSRPPVQPTALPSPQPSVQPSQPSPQPPVQPTALPSPQPSPQPSVQPSPQPSPQPSVQPSAQPSRQPSVQPSPQPSPQPSRQPIAWPTSAPSSQPSEQPQGRPTLCPTLQPTNQPSSQPTSQPSGSPSRAPSSRPSSQPSVAPSNIPSTQPSSRPSMTPTGQPTLLPTAIPSIQPSPSPSSAPTEQPSASPSTRPSVLPSSQPTGAPSVRPTRAPSGAPSCVPTSQPSQQPSCIPTDQPTQEPSSIPTRMPSAQPSRRPSQQPYAFPSAAPSSVPTTLPTYVPTSQPTCQPQGTPTRQPTVQPSGNPSGQPSNQPSRQPTNMPTLGAASSLQLSLSALFDHANRSTAGNSTALLPSLVSLTSSLVASLSANLIKSKDSSTVSTTAVFTSVQVSTADISLIIALLNASYSAGNTSLLPPLYLAGTQSSVRLGADVLGSKSDALVSLTSFSASLLTQLLHGASVTPSSNSSSSHTEQMSPLTPVLSSDVISIQVTNINGSHLNKAVPFEANFSVEDQFYSGKNPNSEVFVHDCKTGLPESVRYHCELSNVDLNLTCTGLATAAVRHTCPIPQRVCSVVSLSTWSVESDDYCKAEVVGTTVLCRCGYPSMNDTSSSKLDGSADGSISVTVMTYFASGQFGGVYKPTVLTDGLVQRSSIVFGTFGGILLVGMLSLAGVMWKLYASRDTVPSGKRSGSSSKKVDVVRIASNIHSVRTSVSAYVSSVLPLGVNPSRAWPLRLMSLLSHHHLYWRVMSAAWSMYRQEHAPVSEKVLCMDIVQIISEFTSACLVLAIVFDLQYPSDDGSCDLHATEDLCLLRRSPLDPSQAFCLWNAVSPPSAGVLTEVSGGKELQRVALEAALLSSTQESRCSYNSTPRSVSAAVLALIIASVVALPVSFGLAYVMGIIRSRPIQDLQHRQALALLQSGRQESNSAVVGSIKATRPTRKPDLLARLIAWYHANVIQTPYTPWYVQRARKDVLSCMRFHTDETSAHHHHHHQHQRARRNRDARLSKSELMRVPSLVRTTSGGTSKENGAANVEYGRYKRMVQYSNDGEFGMVLVQTWFVEALKGGRKLPGSFLLDWMSKQFPSETYSTEIMRQLAMGVVLLVNVGALYYIASKGASRGYDWQLRFLSVCLLNWISEVWYLRVWEVWMLDFYLPSWKMSPVSRLTHAMSSTMTRVVMATIVGDTLTEATAWDLPVRLASLRGSLFESQTVFALTAAAAAATTTITAPNRVETNHPTERIDKEEVEVVDEVVGASVGAQQTAIVPRYVDVVLSLPYWQQYFVARLISSAGLACIVFVWFGIRSKRETWSTSGFLGAIIASVGGLFWYYYRKARVRVKGTLPSLPGNTQAHHAKGTTSAFDAIEADTGATNDEGKASSSSSSSMYSSRSFHSLVHLEAINDAMKSQSPPVVRDKEHALDADEDDIESSDSSQAGDWVLSSASSSSFDDSSSSQSSTFLADNVPVLPSDRAHRSYDRVRDAEEEVEEEESDSESLQALHEAPRNVAKGIRHPRIVVDDRNRTHRHDGHDMDEIAYADEDDVVGNGDDHDHAFEDDAQEVGEWRIDILGKSTRSGRVGS